MGQEQNEETSTVQEIKKMLLNKRVNFLIGSGASKPAIPLMGEVDGDTNDKRNQKLLEQITTVSKYLEGNEIPDPSSQIDNTLSTYVNFIKILIDDLRTRNSRTVPRVINIFSTNYDLFIEKAVDVNFQKNEYFIFNDGANGYFNRILNSHNYDESIAYQGQFQNHIEDIPTIHLIKPHGSVNWERDGESVYIRNTVQTPCFVVKPNGHEAESTFDGNHFFEMLRNFQTELSFSQSVLLVIGFSFQDEHIARMVQRAVRNPELIAYVFCYDDDDREKICARLNCTKSTPNNLKILSPSDIILGQRKFVMDDLVGILGGQNDN